METDLSMAHLFLKLN